MSDRRAAAGKSPAITVTVPLYNEAENVLDLHRRLKETLQSLKLTYEILYIDDGSQDETALILKRLCDTDPYVARVQLSRNFGHQAAVSAGIDHGRGTAVVVMDGDLQDPPEVIPEFVAKWREGFDVVYAVRRNRKEGILKRAAYAAFYRALNAISDLDIPLDSGDFCLMDPRVVDLLKHLPERMRFVRGLRAFVGFRQVGVEYDPPSWAAGRPSRPFETSSVCARRPRELQQLPAASGGADRAGDNRDRDDPARRALLDAIFHRTAPQGWASTVIVVLLHECRPALRHRHSGRVPSADFSRSEGTGQPTLSAHTSRQTPSLKQHSTRWKPRFNGAVAP